VSTDDGEPAEFARLTALERAWARTLFAYWGPRYADKQPGEDQLNRAQALNRVYIGLAARWFALECASLFFTVAAWALTVSDGLGWLDAALPLTVVAFIPLGFLLRRRRQARRFYPHQVNE